MCPRTLGSLLNALFISRKKLKIRSRGTKGKIDPVHTSEGIWWIGSVASLILNLGFSWSWVVNLMPLLPQLCEGTPWFPLNRRLGGPQSRSGCLGWETNLFLGWDLNRRSSSMYPSHYPVLRFFTPFYDFLLHFMTFSLSCVISRNLECILKEIFWLDSMLLSRSHIGSQEYMAIERRRKLLTITILLQLWKFLNHCGASC